MKWDEQREIRRGIRRTRRSTYPCLQSPVSLFTVKLVAYVIISNIITCLAVIVNVVIVFCLIVCLAVVENKVRN